MAREWYYQLMGTVVGPLSADELRQHARDGQIGQDTLVRKGAEGSWVLADKVRGLLGSDALKRPIPKSAPPRVAPDIVPTAHSGKPQPNRLRPWQGWGLAFAFLLVAIVVSFYLSPQKAAHSPPPTSAPTPPIVAAPIKAAESPVDSFREFARTFVPAVREEMRSKRFLVSNGPGADMRYRFHATIEVGDGYDIDVRSSTSLMSPYVGELRLKVRNVFEEEGANQLLILGGSDPFEWKTKTFLFDYKDGAWKKRD
jgi:hypothetical protein